MNINYSNEAKTTLTCSIYICADLLVQRSKGVMFLWYLLVYSVLMRTYCMRASIFCSVQNFSRGSSSTHLALAGFQQKGDLVESDKYSETAKVGAFERGGHISEVFPYQ